MENVKRKAGRPKVPAYDYDEAVRLYMKELWSMRDIGEHFGVAPQVVGKMLKRRGIASMSVVVVKCLFCGEFYKAPRCEARGGRTRYCSRACSNMGQRKHDRRDASRCMLDEVRRDPYGSGEVKHYMNGRQWEDRSWNVRRFETEEEHMQYHQEKNEFLGVPYGGTYGYEKRY